MLEITNEDRRMLSDPRMTAAFAARDADPHLYGAT